LSNLFDLVFQKPEKKGGFGEQNKDGAKIGTGRF